MFFQLFSFFSYLLIRHFRESEVMFAYVRDAEIVDFCHRQAFGRAYRCTKATETTLTHIDIEGCSINALRCTVGSLSNFFSCLDGHDIDTIYRANFRTLIANDTIIDFIMEAVSTVVGYRLHLIRILNGGNTFAIVKIFCVGN